MNKFFAYLLAILSFVGFAVFVILRQRTPFNLSLVQGYQNALLSGLFNTIIVSIVSLLGSMVLGFIFYLLSTTKVKFFQAFTNVFTEIIYGTPLLVMIVMMAFVVGPAFGTFNRNLMGFLGIIIYITPYMTNIFKAAFSSITEDQYMAMELFGFTSYQKYRYIIIPQVIRILMPPLMNNFSLIIKGSALLNVINYGELYYEIAQFTSRTFAFVEGFIIMWLLYLSITIPLSQLTRVIERRWSL